MLTALLSISSLRDAGARGEIADVTGRLSGDKIEIEFAGRQLGGVEAKAAPAPAPAPESAPELVEGPVEAATPSGDSKLRILKIGALRSCAAAGEIHRGDILMVFGSDGEVLHSKQLRSASLLRIALFTLRWRKAAGVKVLREPSWLPFRYTKREVLIPMRDGVRLYTAIYEPASAAGAKPIILMRSPYPVGTYGYGGPGDLSDRIRCFTDRGYIIVEQNVRGTYMSEGVFEDVRPLSVPAPERSLSLSKGVEGPTDESTDAYDTIDWLIANTRNNGSVGIYGVSYPGFYATCAAVCGHPALKIVSPQAPVTDWWMGDDAHHNGALMLCDMYGFGAGFFRPKGNPTPDSAESLSEIPADADLYTWFRGKPLAGLLQPLAEGPEPLKGFVDIVEHPNYDAFWQERNPLRHLKNVRPAVMVVGGLYDAEDAWGPEHTLRALWEQSPETEAYGVFGPWTHGGWRKDADFLERIEAPVFEYYLEGKGEKPAWRDLLIATGSDGSEAAACIGENLAPGKQFFANLQAGELSAKEGLSPSKLPDGAEQLPAGSGERAFPIAPGRYISDPANPVPYMARESHWRDKAYMWADQCFASVRPDVLTQTLEGALSEDLLAIGPVTVRLRFSVSPAKATPAATDGPVAPASDPASQLDLDLVVKLIDVAPDGTQTLVRGDVCPARWRNSTAAPDPLVPGEPAELAFRMASVCHRFAAGHSIALQIQSSWFPLVAMNPQTFLQNPYTATEKDYRPVEVEILSGAITVGR